MGRNLPPAQKQRLNHLNSKALFMANRPNVARMGIKNLAILKHYDILFDKISDKKLAVKMKKEIEKLLTIYKK